MYAVCGDAAGHLDAQLRMLPYLFSAVTTSSLIAAFGEKCIYWEDYDVVWGQQTFDQIDACCICLKFNRIG